MTDVDGALDLAHREEWAKVLATLARQVGGDLALAEDAVQDAFAAAAAQWPGQGVPRNPGAWLTTTARRRAVDRIRRELRLLNPALTIFPVKAYLEVRGRRSSAR